LRYCRAATIIPPSRPLKSHPDCRALPIQIVALQPIATSTPSSARTQIEAAIAPLPASEYPNLKEHVDLLADDPLKRGSEGYLGVVSMRYSNSVIALLKSVTK
jgi:hypothetical protein